MDNDLSNEQSRLRSLRTLGILDTPAEERFDQFTRLASAAFGVPIALVSLVDQERQWFKSRQGLPVSETHRSLAFCSHAIESADTMVVEDALQDPRFADNHLVLGEPRIRFYAGHPIRTHEGFPAGTLCIIDTKPRSLSDAQRSMLQSLAKMVEHELNRDCLIRARDGAESALQELNATLDKRVQERTRELEQKNEALSREIRQRTEVEASLRRSEERVRTMIETSFSVFVAADEDGRIIEWNSSAERVFGWSREEVLGLSLSATIIPPEFRAAHEAGMARFAQTGFGATLNRNLQVSALTRSGAVIPVEMSISTFMLDGRPYFGAFLNDVSAPLQAEERLRTITDNVPVLISYLDSEFRFQFANAMYKDWLGRGNSDMLGKTVEEVFGAVYFEERKPGLMRALGGRMSNVEVEVHRKGRGRILSTTYIPHHRDGQVVGIYVLATDSTAAREHERQLSALANADPLTNLPNRRMYEFHLGKSIALAKRQGTQLGLMFLDLDNFKKINDTLGHGAGDAVLVEFGIRVRSALRESDMLARLAGDEFTVVLEAVGNIENCKAVAAKILEVLNKPFPVAGQLLQISASIGIALSGAGATADSLAHEADAALYASKRKGKNQFCVTQQLVNPAHWREARAG